jgi:DNA-directed RNA polymerase specialized sigma24 family protein
MRYNNYKTVIAEEKIEIDVDAKWFEILQKMDAEDKKNYRKETRNTISLNYCENKGMFFSSQDDDEPENIEYEKFKGAFLNVLKEFNAEQKSLLMKHFVDKKSFTQIANELGVSRQSLTERIMLLVKKIRKKF